MCVFSEDGGQVFICVEKNFISFIWCYTFAKNFIKDCKITGFEIFEKI